MIQIRYKIRIDNNQDHLLCWHQDCLQQGGPPKWIAVWLHRRLKNVLEYLPELHL
jgi:hypothetical protein